MSRASVTFVIVLMSRSGTGTGIRACDCGRINTASMVRNRFSFELVKLKPTKRSYR